MLDFSYCVPGNGRAKLSSAIICHCSSGHTVVDSGALAPPGQIDRSLYPSTITARKLIPKNRLLINGDTDLLINSTARTVPWTSLLVPPLLQTSPVMFGG